MGHLVNPLGFRLGLVDSWIWEDVWCVTDLHYSEFVYNNYKMHEYLHCTFDAQPFKDCGILYSHFRLYKRRKKFYIYVYVYDGMTEEWVDICLSNLVEGDDKVTGRIFYEYLVGRSFRYRRLKKARGGLSSLNFLGMRQSGLKKFKDNQHIGFASSTIPIRPFFWVASSLFVSHYCEIALLHLGAYHRYTSFVEEEDFSSLSEYFSFLSLLGTIVSFFYKMFISIKEGRIGFLNEGLCGYVNLSLWGYSDTMTYNCEPFRYIRHKALTNLRSNFRDIRLMIGSRLLPNWRRMFLFKITMGKTFAHGLRAYMLYWVQGLFYSTLSAVVCEGDFDRLSILRPSLVFLGVRNSEVTSQMLGRYIGIKLQDGYTLWELINPLRRELEHLKTLEFSPLLGFKFHFRGRFTRKQRSDSIWVVSGSVPFSNSGIFIDYSFSEVVLKNSMCSLKIWIYRKMISNFRIHSYRIHL